MVRPQHDLDELPRRSPPLPLADHSAALREIREWPPAEIEAAVAACDGGAAAPSGPRHRVTSVRHGRGGRPPARGGRLAVARGPEPRGGGHPPGRVGRHLNGRHAAARYKRAGRRRPATRAGSGRESTSGTSTWPWRPPPSPLGSPTTAGTFADEARAVAPLDPEAQLVLGCVAESCRGARPQARRVGRRPPARPSGPRAADALALDPGQPEARLRLGKLPSTEGRLAEAESLLDTGGRASGRRPPPLPGPPLPRSSG